MLLFFGSSAEAKPAPGVSGLLSIIPGLGQVANGDTLEGVAWFVTIGASLAVKDPVSREFGANFWMYNMYDAYRDAGAKPATNYSALENYVANFNPLNVIDPIGALFLGTAAITKGNTKANKGTPSNAASRALYYTSVGFGEEGLFRGFLFPGLSNLFGSKWTGAIVSSVIFSAAHGGGAFVGRFIAGMLFCWQVDYNKYDLRHNIFAHTWFDFLITRNGKTENDIGAVLKHEWRF